MKSKILFLTVSLLYISGHSFSQGAYYHISNPDTAYSGIDVIYEEGFHILGNAWNFSPPYSGIPIEGEYSFGNVYFFMGGDGSIEHQTYLDNNEIFPSFEGLGRIPGTFFFSVKNESIILPYTKHYGIVQCANPTMLQNTFRLGIFNIEKNGNQYSVKDTIYNQFGLCENKGPIGYFGEDDSYLLILKDNVDMVSMVFNRYDLQNNLISEYQKKFSSFEVKIANIIVDEIGNPILLGWDPMDDYNMSLMKTTPQGDSLAKTNIHSSTHPFTPVAISGDQNNNHLIAAYRYNLDYSEVEYFLFCYDADLNEKWRNPFPFKINAIASLKGGQGHLVVHIPVLGPPTSFNVGYVNNTGELVASVEYGQENDIPQKIKVFDDSLFAVVGTKFIGYEASTVGNPYASIFLSADTVRHFLLSDINEQSIDNKTKLIVHPNPSDGTVNISISTEYRNSPKLVEVYGLGGLKLNSQIIRSGSQQIYLDLNNLPSGTYIGIVHFEDGFAKPFRFSVFP